MALVSFDPEPSASGSPLAHALSARAATNVVATAAILPVFFIFFNMPLSSQ
jgi:hypothetical protein